VVEHLPLRIPIAVEDKQELNEPLKPGWAFAAQVQLEDYARGTPVED
jgi:hypothetical protein